VAPAIANGIEMIAIYGTARASLSLNMFEICVLCPVNKTGLAMNAKCTIKAPTAMDTRPACCHKTESESENPIIWSTIEIAAKADNG
jgi:hypothetical protein